MSEQPRKESPCSLYHITSSGNHNPKLFSFDADRKVFLKLFEQTCKNYHWRVYAWCLMDNYYQLVIKTTRSNLTRGMGHLTGVYTQMFNRKHQRIGDIFQNDYKAVLIDKNNHLLEAVRYVLLNPVRSNMSKTAGQYLWSSYWPMIGKTIKPDCLEKDRILNLFDKCVITGQKKFIQFIREGKNQRSVWEHPGKQFKHSINIELSDMQEVRRHQSIKPHQYYLSKQSYQNSVIHSVHNRGGFTQKEITDYFGSNYSNVSKVMKKY